MSNTVRLEFIQDTGVFLSAERIGARDGRERDQQSEEKTVRRIFLAYRKQPTVEGHASTPEESFPLLTGRAPSKR